RSQDPPARASTSAEVLVRVDVIKKRPVHSLQLALALPGLDCPPLSYCGREPACEFSESLPERGLSAIHGDRVLFACAGQVNDVRTARSVIGDRDGSRTNPCGAWSELDTDFAARSRCNRRAARTRL